MKECLFLLHIWHARSLPLSLIRSDRALRVSERDCPRPSGPERSAHVGVSKEVDQDHNGNDHADHSGPEVGMWLGESQHTVEQADNLDDHRGPEGPTLECPQSPGEEE